MNDRRYRALRRQRDILLICLIISLIACALLYVRQQVQPPSFQTSIQKSLSHVTPVTNTHIIGGFSANTADKIINAAGDGIQTIFYYGNPPDEDSVLGQQLQSLHMKIVDGFISSNLHYYECQKARAMLFPPYGLNIYCGQASYPTFASEDAFLASIADHVKQSQANPLIIGYWVLDDWPSWDAGGARQLLMEIHEILQQYTPALLFVGSEHH